MRLLITRQRLRTTARPSESLFLSYKLRLGAMRLGLWGGQSRVQTAQTPALVAGPGIPKGVAGSRWMPRTSAVIRSATCAVKQSHRLFFFFPGSPFLTPTGTGPTSWDWQVAPGI